MMGVLEPEPIYIISQGVWVGFPTPDDIGDVGGETISCCSTIADV